MPKRKKAPVVAVQPTLTKKQLLERIGGVHPDSPIYISLWNPFGIPSQVRVLAVRCLMQDTGKVDTVELITADR